MARSSPSSRSIQIHRLSFHRYIDALCWLPHLSPLTSKVVLASFDSDTSTPSLQINAFLKKRLDISPQYSISLPSRITSLKVCQSRPIIAASTISGSVLCYTCDPNEGTLNFEFSVPETGFHDGVVSGIDLNEDGSECVSVGEDGRINLVNFGASGSFRRLFDANGLVSYSAVRWASPVEFVTAGVGGFGLHLWDKRKPGGAAASFKGNWADGASSGIVHSIDIHPSRKHTCLAGGSFGTVFAWDTRWPKEPLILCMAGTDVPVFAESDILEVRFDNYAYSSKNQDSSSSRVLPAMICSEDGILAVIELGEQPIEILAEPCAINSFDINPQNPSDVICCLEWESLAILSRP